jgi:hypothetical protein
MSCLLSVIVHGRNDSHGYNLHKRVALSLNCVTHLLSGDDEVIFVDWNTPDELPTLPEAIADTLTEECRRRLRVLRVRPRQHRQVCGQSHLPTLDAMARNVALRRLAPPSRWVLSTTTDIVIVPRNRSWSLATVVDQLSPALYHLPRFDIPEALWESLDRRDPAAAIEICEAWGGRFHLREIVEADPIVRYDGPGDFQLLPVNTVRDLSGFDERMVFTYHTDSNLAKRASLVLGPVNSLADKLLLYHCNHYRQSSVHHGPRRAENSWLRFFEDIDRPDLPWQVESWGMPDEAIEEIALAQIARPRIAAALEAVVAPAGDSWTVSNRTEDFNRLDYRAEHVLPFIADLLSTVPADSVVGVFAATTRLTRLLASLWRELGFTEPILVATAAVAAGESGILLTNEDDILRRATILVFEFGSDAVAEPFANPTALAELAAVDGSFRRAVERERQRLAEGCAAGQRFIVVNAVNTVFERLVANNLAFTYTPFTGRIRYGIVARESDPLATDVISLSRWLTQKMGRALPAPYQEVVSALDELSWNLSDEDAAPMSGSALALFDHPRLCEALGQEPAIWKNRAAAAGMQRGSLRVAASGLVIHRKTELSKGRPALNKFAAIEDWDDPEWREALISCDAAFESSEYPRRHRSVWELGQLLHAAGTLVTGGTALAVLAARNALPVYLSRLLGRVVVAPAGGTRAGSIEEVWPPSQHIYDPRCIDLCEDDVGLRTSAPYQLIVLPDNALLADGVDGLPHRLAALEALLETGGIIAVAVETVIAGDLASDRLPGRFVAQGQVERLIARHTGLRAVGASDWRLSESTLDRLAVAGTPSEREPHFIIQIGRVFSATAVWVLQKTGSTNRSGWENLAKDWLVHAH